MTPEEFTEDGDGYTAQIPDTQAHAWVEVYRSGKGWIPVEVTPGYQENTGGNENQEVTGEESTLTPEPTAEQSREATPELTETPQPEQEEASLTPESENDQGTEEQETNTENGSGEQRPEGIGHAFLKLFVILLILVGLAGGSVGIVSSSQKTDIAGAKQLLFPERYQQGNL